MKEEKVLQITNDQRSMINEYFRLIVHTFRSVLQSDRRSDRIGRSSVPRKFRSARRIVEFISFVKDNE